jgi:hypothetical protein
VKNPFGDQPIPGSYHNLQERVSKKVSAKVTDSVVDMLVKAYENALNEENVMLGRPERNRLLQQVAQSVLKDVQKRLEK